jgi:hypothetical protein
MDNIAWQTTDDGWFISIVYCQSDQISPGNFLLPGGAVRVKPPENYTDNQLPWWNKETQSWEIKEHPALSQVKLEKEKSQNLESRLDRIEKCLEKLLSEKLETI